MISSKKTFARMLLGLSFTMTALLATTAVFFQAVPVSAASTPNYVVLAPLPDTTLQNCTGDSSTGAGCQTNVVTYLSGLIQLAIAAAGVLSVVMITMGGFEYILSASVGGKSNAKDTIQNAVVGLMLALLSYLILYTINPSLTTIKFGLPNNTQNPANSNNITASNPAATPAAPTTPAATPTP